MKALGDSSGESKQGHSSREGQSHVFAWQRQAADPGIWWQTKQSIAPPSIPRPSKQKLAGQVVLSLPDLGKKHLRALHRDTFPVDSMLGKSFTSEHKAQRCASNYPLSEWLQGFKKDAFSFHSTGLVAALTPACWVLGIYSLNVPGFICE